jgi:HAMP domain-containing protein
MIVICEECGKKYQVDVSKMHTAKAQFACKSCGHYVTVSRPADASMDDYNGSAATIESETSPLARAADYQTDSPAGDEPEDVRGAEASSRGLSIRSKMFLLFFIIPILCIAAAGGLYVVQLNTLSSTITGKSAKVINAMAEDLIALKAKTVAKQCGIFLEAHPGLKKEEFNKNPEFKKITTQKVGKTGYTLINEVPDEKGRHYLWTHPNEKLIGVDLIPAMKKALGKDYGRWWKVASGAFKGKESRGYYSWKDADGKIREKFMVQKPIKGTPFIVAATTYLDEFTSPVESLEKQLRTITKRTRNTVFSIMAGTILLIGMIVFLYGLRLTGRIKSLTDVADRISVGELDAEVEPTSNDEIGELSNAVSRMQESIRLSIERIRRRV